MANSHLLDLCETFTTDPPVLTVVMIPFTTGRANVLQEAFEKIVPRDEWANSRVADSLLTFYTYFMDVTVNDPKSAVARMFQMLWDARELPLEERWQMIQELYNDTFYGVLITCFLATRDHSFDAPAALQMVPPEDAEGEQSRATKQRRQVS